MATLTTRGVPVQEAVIQINNSITQLLRTTSETGKVFREVANQSFEEFIKQGGTLREAIDLIAEASEKTGRSIFEIVPEVRAARGVQALAEASVTWARNTDDMC